MTPDQALLIMWLTFAAMAVLGLSGVLVWAIRTRQFSNQNRARYLPLVSKIPPAKPAGKTPRGGDHVPA